MAEATPAPDRVTTATPAVGADVVNPPRPGTADAIRYALETMAAARAKYRQVTDYSCTFMKRERINGRLTDYHIMSMKGRTQPHSIYFKFMQPNAGREAIYVHGRNDGRAYVHDVGIGRLLAGTLSLDPLSKRAMDGNRHPISDAGIGFMIDSIIEGWTAEMRPEETKVHIEPQLLVDKRPCTRITCQHPVYNAAYKFHEVRVYIDHEHGLPVRFEAYDWPKIPGGKPELVEEYTYTNLRLNVGLSDHDFDPSNKAYSFGRF